MEKIKFFSGYAVKELLDNINEYESDIGFFKILECHTGYNSDIKAWIAFYRYIVTTGE